MLTHDVGSERITIDEQMKIFTIFNKLVNCWKELEGLTPQTERIIY